MRAGIFGAPAQTTEAAIAEGLRALGFAVEFQRASVWTPDQARPYSVVVVRGLRLHSRGIYEHYAARGVPVLVHDLPALRKPGYFALWAGAINALPDAADGRRARVFDLQPRRTGGRKILVCGQKRGDQAHHMDKETLRSYFAGVALGMKSNHPDCEIVWRPHPQEPFDLYWVEQQNPARVPLEKALADTALRAVATFNSTCGVHALEAGVPVYCDRSSFYAELSGEPTPSRRAWFERLSYTQWTLAELATPEPYLFNLPAEAAA